MLKFGVTEILEGYLMPDLSPQAHVPKLKDNWYMIVSNPEEPDDNSLCIQIKEGPFCHVIVKY